jgi:methylmalonyl-CoA epimerase
MNKKIDHIGIAVKDLQERISNIEKVLDLACSGTDEVKEQKVRVGIVPVQDVNIEFLEATDNDSPIAKFIEKKGEGFHHIALEVDNIEEELVRLKNENVQLIDETYRIGAHGTKIAFIHPKSTGGLLVELVEKEG